MSAATQCCGACRWWGEPGPNGISYRECTWRCDDELHIPDAWEVTTDHPILRADGASCPCFSRKEESDGD